MELTGPERGRKDWFASTAVRGSAGGVNRVESSPRSSWSGTGAGGVEGTSLLCEHIGPEQGTCDGISGVDRPASARSLADFT